MNTLKKPWYKEPWLWFVLAGPLVVVVAGFITLAIAINGADPLVSADYYKKGIALSQKNKVDEDAMLPARQARNKAALIGSQTSQQADLPESKK